jgi:hypothetical protein
LIGVVVVFILSLPVATAATASAAGVSDEFVRGYTSALIKYQYQGKARAVVVEQGVVFLHGLDIAGDARQKLIRQLKEIEGVTRVVIVPKTKAATGAELPAGATSTDGPLPIFLPRGQLFQTLLADPRWPHFSAAYQRYYDDDQLNNVAATSFGEMFGIYRFTGPADSVMQVGIQAGVFAIFDLDADSFDLINADYLVGIPLTTKKDNFSNLTRIFHQSSHLGDEFLLRGRTDKRVNLSYESVSSLFSWELPAGFRVYAGGGYIFHSDPSDLDPWSTQVGLEFRSPWTLSGGALRPVAALDLQNRQESDWDMDISTRAGLQFENPDFLERKLQLLMEYYSGKSPHGQFYENTIEHFGVGLHFFFD